MSAGTVGVRGLHVMCIIGIRPHERIAPQPLVVDFDLDGLLTDTVAYTDDLSAGGTGEVPGTIDYSEASRRIEAMLIERQFLTIEAAAVAVCEVLCLEFRSPSCRVTVAKPSALAGCIGSSGAHGELGGPRVSVQRSRKELLALSKRVLPHLSESSNATQAEDRQSVPSTDTAKSHHAVASPPASGAASPGSLDRVFFALGSNMGDRVANIHRAIRLLEEHCLLVDSSHLYETAPAYVTEQPPFLNAVIEMRSALSLNLPELLRFVKRTEMAVGRTPSVVRYGPRVIDIDILLVGQQCCHIGLVDDIGPLVIPHERIVERDFVLQPLCDIAPRLLHPVAGRSFYDLLSALGDTSQNLQRVVPMGRCLAVGTTADSGAQSEISRLWQYPFEAPVLMGVVNATPDSFSDGGKFNSAATATARAATHIANGARILDIGGQSTRPNAPVVSAKEEWSRLADVLTAIHEQLTTEPSPKAVVSLDTFWASVAERGLERGWVDVINDVSACNMDPGMAEVIRRHRCAIVLTHSRMQPASGNSTDPSNYDYGDRDIVTAVRSQLQTTVQNLRNAGILRWQIIIDPGAGFAKKYEQTVEVLRRLHDIGNDDSPEKNNGLGQYPMMIGLSRKGFVGKACQRPQADASRDIGSAAFAVTAYTTASLRASNPGRDITVDIVRCHDVAVHRDALLAAQAMSPTTNQNSN